MQPGVYFHRAVSSPASGLRGLRAVFPAAGVALALFLAPTPPLPVAVAAAGPAAPARVAPSSTAPAGAVLVSGADVRTAAAAVLAAGGRVTAGLPLIGAVAAVLPEGSRLPAGLLVTPDRAVGFASVAASPTVAVSTVRTTIGLPPTGDDGHGVTVAVVDTGVADQPDLSGHIAAHLDVTGTGPGDGFGHGTLIAGLIAQSGAASAGAYVGVAPGARILDVKVGWPDGHTGLIAVLQGLQLVADQGHRYGVEVVNLSLTSGSPVPYQVDPLNQALRALWRLGFTVVVPAGNDGPAPGSIDAPGNDPTLLTVGALDEAGTGVRADDSIPSWSSRGPTSQGVAKPDLAAPGVSVIGLRSPGSVVDTAHPQARVGDAYVRGSGTSMATAVVSGAAADLLARYPRLQPDDVKALLTGAAYGEPGLADPTAAGSGGLDLAAALAAGASARQGHSDPGHSGQGGSDQAPGSPGVWRALAAAFDAGDVAAAQRAWAALGPAARSWAARSWAALDPVAQAWVARSWATVDPSGQAWTNTGVSAQEWAARSWAARSWAGDDWAARSWAARSWAARSWAGADWAARSWAADGWAARSWAALW